MHTEYLLGALGQMPHIFISYAKKETSAMAKALADALVCIPGLTAWMDRELLPGQYWTTEIMTQIDNCNYFIVLLSPDVNRPITPKQDRSYVLNELDYVKDLEDKKPVLPVMVIKTIRPVQIAGLQSIDVTSTPTDPARIVKHVCAHFRLPYEPRKPAEPQLVNRKPTVAEEAEAEQWCEQGWAKFNGRYYLGALADFDHALRLNPHNDLALWRRAMVRLELNDNAGVITDLNKFLRRCPKHEDALCTRGLAKLQQADYSGAVADFSTVLKSNPQSIYALGSRGEAKMKLGDYEGALVDFQAALAVDPNLGWVEDNRNVVLRKLRYRA